MGGLALVDRKERLLPRSGDLEPALPAGPAGRRARHKVIGREDALLVYMTDRFYNPQDEGRIPYNDPSINYDWETQRK